MSVTVNAVVKNGKVKLEKQISVPDGTRAVVTFYLENAEKRREWLKEFYKKANALEQNEIVKEKTIESDERQKIRIEAPPIDKRKSIPYEAILDVVEQIVEKFDPEKIILFGSYANGTHRPESDVDLLVLMDSDLRNVEQAIQISRAIEYHFGLDLLVRKPSQFKKRIAMGDSFLREIAETGKILYERVDERMG